MVELTVRRALELAAQRFADRKALRCGNAAWTYSELDARANCIANALLAAGARQGDRVAVVLPNCMDYVAIALACAKAALVMVTLNYRFTAAEYALQLQDCGARVLVYGEEYATPVLAASESLTTLTRICRGSPAAGDLGNLEALAKAQEGKPLDSVVHESDVFYLGYTSGTTGRPKGAMVTQRNRALAYHYWALTFGIGPDDVALHCGPFHHTAPFTFTLTQLYRGGQVVILEQFDAAQALHVMEQHRVSWAFMVPFMLDRLLEAGPDAFNQARNPALRMLISGGTALPTVTKEGLLRAMPGLGLHEFYGATEAGVITNLAPDEQSRKRRCVGRPVLDMEIDVRLDGKSLPRGEIGEIWLRGPTMFSGYYQAPEKNAEVFDGDWCTIGDLGRLDDEGYLYIVDRSKDVIKSGAVNIFPVEIEEVLLAQAGVRDVAVIGIPDARWGEAVHAVVVPREGVLPAVDTLASACRAMLAGYKVPKSFEFRNELPRNANGKVLKRTLREQCAERLAQEQPL